jgi:hypothetical protein
VSRKVFHDLMAAQHFKSFFVICIIRIFTMKIEEFQLCSNNSVCTEAFQLLGSHASVQLRGNIDVQYVKLKFKFLVSFVLVKEVSPH